MTNREVWLAFLQGFFGVMVLFAAIMLVSGRYVYGRWSWWRELK